MTTFRRRVRQAQSLVVVACALGALSACAAPGNATNSAAKPGVANPDTRLDPRDVQGVSEAEQVPATTPIARQVPPQLPVSLSDHGGTPVTVVDVSRIIALDIYGTLANTVVGLGLGKNLVGRTPSNSSADLAPLPLVTQNGHALNSEAILALRPTIVLTDSSIGPREVLDQLRASGVAVVFLDSTRSLATVSPQIAAVAHALGVDAAGHDLATRTQREVENARAEITAMAPAEPRERMRMAFLYARGTGGVFFALGAGTGATDLIEALGGVDASSIVGIVGVRPASSEALLTLNPELILTMTNGLASTGGINGLMHRPGVGDTIAGQNRRVVHMDDGQILSFGPQTAAILRSLASAIYAPPVLEP